MPPFAKARSFLRNLFLFRRVEADLDKEVRSHLELMTEENIRAGMGPEEARRAARLELGGVEQVKEQVRDERTGNWVRSVISDCRFGIRQLRKSSGFPIRGRLFWLRLLYWRPAYWLTIYRRGELLPWIR